MSDDRVRTFVATDAGELPFQDYFVRRRCDPAVAGFRFAGSENARVPLVLRELLDSSEVEAVILCPSNPYVSIAPMLAVGEIRDWLERRTFPLVAVSPIIGGEAVKGPAAKMMRELGLEASASAVAQHYGALVDGWVIDERDASLAPAIQALEKQVVVTDTLMTERSRSLELARAAVDFAARLKPMTTFSQDA